jgi:lipid-A-disaccharide synthase-like uncharacterized protein
MMDWLHAQLWSGNQFKWWEIVGWLGNAVFFSRFFIQWYVTEKKKQVVVPLTFLWLSLAGSLLLLAYAIFSQKSLVFICSFAFTWIPYLRNLIIHHRHKDSQVSCGECGTLCPPQAKFCFECGARLLGVSGNSTA